MKVLIVGGGGREHALAWKVAQSRRVAQVYVAPGNAGTAHEPRVQNVDIDPQDLAGLLNFVGGHEVHLTIVGPEAPLVAGITDQFAAAGLRCFGPGKAAAQLEGSKAFAKAFMQRHNIPTAHSLTFSDVGKAHEHITQVDAPLVIKADGLAAGKGVIVAQTTQEAQDAASAMLAHERFGPAGHRIVVEEYLAGEEASFICMVAGDQVMPLASSQDHKARDDGDRGPNTGGMGAYSPAPAVDAVMHDKIMERIIRPTVTGLAREDIAYTGFLYAGLMITADGQPRVLEYNCRLGDPEAQPIVLRLNADLLELCDASLEGTLTSAHVEWDPRCALGVVMTAGGYPGSYRRGDPISGLDAVSSDLVKVFHAGTSIRDQSVVTNGGRVLCVTALGRTVTEAQRRAYRVASDIGWQDAYYRRDIGYRAVAREQTRA